MAGVHFHGIELKRGNSSIDPPKWLKNKKATINPKHLKDYYCFQYEIIAALHHQGIRNNAERIRKLKVFIDNYNWKDINFQARPDDWNKFERYNKDIALTFYQYHITKKKKIFNTNQIIITNVKIR